MKLSIIIVNYNVKHFLEQCLNSVNKASKKLAVEVWVVDNNSVDGSIEMLKEKFPEVKLIENKKNAGFSVANNQAIKKSTGEYVLLLNPDTIVEEETFTKTLAFMDGHPDAGGLGVKMIDGTGHFLPESKRALPTPEVAFYKIFGLSFLFPKSKKFGKYHLTYLSQDETNKVDVLSGAFMLVRKAALDKAGLLDETFFMYGEDIDMSYRIIKAGYNNYYFPQTRIIHYKGESTKKSSVNYVIVFYNAMRIFAQKHFSHKNARLFSFLVNMAILFRASVAIMHRFINKMILPLIDFITIYAGYYIISLFYANIKFSSEGHYSGIFMLFILPSYIVIWLFCILFSGGYDKPIKQWKIVRGILWGVGFILIMYALLPDVYRFSRALILIGTVWVILALTTIRALLMAFKVKGFASYNRRLLIIGEEEECKRVQGLLERTGIKLEEVRYLSPEDTQAEKNGESFNKWSETVTIYHINEVIFCAKDLPSQTIMDAMSTISAPELEFKIAPPESWAIIGSNSIHTSGELYMINVHAINTASNVRNKRLFDIVLGLVLLAISPLFCWIQRNPPGFFANLFWVIIGEKSYVGYASAGEQQKSLHLLPTIKKGVLTPLDALPSTADNSTIHDINSIYARDYKVATDIRIVWKGFRNLGRITN